MKRKHSRKLVVYRTMGKLDYFEYHYDGVWKNKTQCEKWLAKHPNYQYGSYQVIRGSRNERYNEYLRFREMDKPMTITQILEFCKNRKETEREQAPKELKPETEYTYNRESADEWMKLAQDNDWDLSVSLKPLCEHLGLAPVVVAPVLIRYGLIEKKKKLTPEEKAKTYKYSKEQVQVWWNDKVREGLTIQQLAERVGVHFLQLGKAFSQYDFTPKKVKLSKAEKKELKKQKKLAKNK